jgi:hypothetical protein
MQGGGVNPLAIDMADPQVSFLHSNQTIAARRELAHIPSDAIA